MVSVTKINKLHDLLKGKPGATKSLIEAVLFHSANPML
jgi:hypothetical protein